MVLRLILIAAVGIFIACGNTENSTSLSIAQNNTSKTGIKLYKTYCQSCHGKKGDAQRGGAANLSTSIIAEKEIRKIILYGNNNGMMAYKDLLQDKQELDSIVVHVQKLRTK